MKSFEDVFNMYCVEVKPKDANTMHKPGQVREKYTEIIAAVGIDGNMLKVNRILNYFIIFSSTKQ